VLNLVPVRSVHPAFRVASVDQPKRATTSLAASVDHTEASTGVANGPSGGWIVLMLLHLFRF
jgi:hypothetical protein